MGAPMSSKGRKTVEYELDDGGDVRVDYQVGNVHRPILSVGVLNAAGHTCVFTPKEAWIEKNRRYLTLRRENDVFFLRARVRRAEDGAVPVYPVEAGSQEAEEAPEIFRAKQEMRTVNRPSVQGMPRACLVHRRVLGEGFRRSRLSSQILPRM